MSKLYIANATKQYIDFHFRLPERSDYLKQRIAPLGQIAISGDLSSRDVDAVINQHARYGMIGAHEVNGRMGRHPLIYSENKPVERSTIEAVHKNNTETMVIEGKEIRRIAAVAANNLFEQRLSETGVSANIEEIEIVAQQMSRDPETNDAPQLSEGVTVTKNPEKSEQRNEMRRRRALAA